MRNNGKIKEVQIKLMLSSRTEMQKVIEAARSQSLAAFMPATSTMPSGHTALPAAVPTMVPAAVPEVPTKAGSRERDSRSKENDKRRSRSRSRDRKERCANAIFVRVDFQFEFGLKERKVI